MEKSSDYSLTIEGDFGILTVVASSIQMVRVIRVDAEVARDVRAAVHPMRRTGSGWEVQELTSSGRANTMAPRHDRSLLAGADQ